MTPSFRVLVGFSALAFASAGCGKASTEEVQTETVVPVTTAPAMVGAIRAVIRATGDVNPGPGAELIVTAPQPARIVEITKAEGDRVQRGEVLVRFEIPDLSANVVSQGAQVTAATARVRVARENQTRLQDLFTRGVASRKEVEDADKELADAQSALSQAQAGQGSAQQLASRATVAATFNGVIAKRNHNPGDLVDAATTDFVLRVIDPTRLQVDASVAIPDLSRINIGASARVVVAEGQDPIPMKVASRPAAVEPGTAAAPVRLTFQSTPSLAIGTPVQVEIDAEEHTNVVLVPAEAIVREARRDRRVYRGRQQSPAPACRPRHRRQGPCRSEVGREGRRTGDRHRPGRAARRRRHHHRKAWRKRNRRREAIREEMTRTDKRSLHDPRSPSSGPTWPPHKCTNNAFQDPERKRRQRAGVGPRADQEMTVAASALRYSSACALVAAALVVGGVISAFSLPSSIYPPLQFPRIVIIAESGTLPSQSMMLIVTRPLEQAALEVPGIRRVRSKSIRGATEISAQFEPATDMVIALQQLQNRVAEIRGDLPADTVLTVERLTPAVFPVFMLALTGNLPTADLTDYALYVIRPALARVPGAGQIQVQASDTREIEVVLDPLKLSAAGLTVTEVSDKLKAQNLLAPVGRFAESSQQHLSLASGLWSSVNQIASAPVIVKQGATIRVADLGTVTPGAPDRTLLVTANGREAVSLSISQQIGANILDLRAGIEQTLADLAHTLPAGLRITKVYDLGEFVASAITNVRDAILIGGFLAIVVLIVFLRDCA